MINVIYSAFAARDLVEGDVFALEGHSYSVKALHTASLEGYDRFNRVALEAQDLDSPMRRTYLFSWDANQVVRMIQRGTKAA